MAGVPISTNPISRPVRRKPLVDPKAGKPIISVRTPVRGAWIRADDTLAGMGRLGRDAHLDAVRWMVPHPTIASGSISEDAACAGARVKKTPLPIQRKVRSNPDNPVPTSELPRPSLPMFCAISSPQLRVHGFAGTGDASRSGARPTWHNRPSPSHTTLQAVPGCDGSNPTGRRPGVDRPREALGGFTDTGEKCNHR